MTGTPIIVGLLNSNTWFQNYPNVEMQTTNTSSFLNPSLAFTVSGLVPNKKYTISLCLKKTVAVRFDEASKKWEHIGNGEEIDGSERRIPHFYGCLTGAQWQAMIISFANIKITNQRKHIKSDVVYLEMYFKYAPILFIQECEEPYDTIRFIMRMAQFVAVPIFKSPAHIKQV